MYILIKDVEDELEGFIQSGRTDATEFHVFSQEQEQAMANYWAQLGFKAAYRSQQIGYMHRRVTIKYLNVRNPATGVNISLIPWFLLPGRPFPIFIYAFAIWHYHKTGKASLSLSAASAGKVFGVDRLSKSTVSRNIKAMEEFIDIYRIDEPLPASGPKTRADKDVARSVAEILTGCPKGGLPEEIYGETVQALPGPIKRSEAVCRALADIPGEYSKVIKPECAAERKTRDVRKRPARPRRKATRLVQRLLEFIDSHQIEKIRKAFIPACMHMALDSAVIYHRFLL